jgi:hypothetical protein
MRRLPAAAAVRRSAVLAGLLFLPFLSANAPAQDNYEIQVYGHDLVSPGRTMVELHSNYTIQGFKTTADGVYPDDGAEHETVEITHGFTSWFECGFYVFTSIQPGLGWGWVGDHIRPRFAIPDSWHWPVGISVSNEIGYQRRAYAVDTWTWEIRPIVDKRLGRWYLAFNPALDLSLHGANQGRGLAFSPNFKLSFDVTPKIVVGAEYYGSLGPISGVDPANQQVHQLFPAVDLNLAPRWEINFGLGFGLTPATEGLIAKAILGYSL